MTTRALLFGASVSLIGSIALAQATNPPHVDMPIEAQKGKVETGVVSPPPKAPQPKEGGANAVTYPSVAVPAGNTSPYLSDNVSGPTASVAIVKSEPSPDTPESRRQYPPLSGAGQRSAATGN